MRSGRIAATFLALGGLVVVYGSFATWDVCQVGLGGPFCEGSSMFPSSAPRSGVGLGIGIVTAELGLLLSIAGIWAFRRSGTSTFRSEILAVATLIVLIVVVYLVRTFVVPEFHIPLLGVYLVAAGAAVGLVAGSRLTPPDPSTRRWAEARRVPIALILAGVAVWALALGWHLGPDRFPLAFALFLIAVGVGLWPASLPFTRLRPGTIGLLIVGYGAVSLAANVLGLIEPWPLRAGPFIVLIGVIVVAKLEPPAEHPSRDQPSQTTLSRFSAFDDTLPD